MYGNRTPAWIIRLAESEGLSANEPLRIAIFAPGVWRRRARLRQLLGSKVKLQFGHAGGANAVAGWGLKGQGRQRANEIGLPYLAIEDAFLARLGEDEATFGALGILADPIGIYYDASHPSLLEEIISDTAGTDPGSYLRETIRQLRIGKFNTLDPNKLNHPQTTSRTDVVVVDQIRDDLSIAGGQATERTFADLLEAAFDENPGARIGVKLHPYDGIGGRTGHLRILAEKLGAKVLDQDSNWMSVAEQAERVYVVSSNAGLEALIAGTQVTCFGIPFYGGWGLTDDRQTADRRIARPSLDEVLDAAYEQYGAYWLPSLKRRGTALELARFMGAQQRHARLFRDGLDVYGTQRLKHSHFEAFLPPNKSSVRTFSSCEASNKSPARTSAIWSSRVKNDKEYREHWRASEGYFVEDGFIRSAGLGADLVRPNSLVFDRSGIYYDPESPSDLVKMLATENVSASEVKRAERLVDILRATKITKYNLSDHGTIPNAPEDVTKILVPGQVENDASIVRGSATVKTNAELLRVVRSKNPTATIYYKPHPDVAHAGRPGHVSNPLEYADEVLADISAHAAIELVDEVHSITSLLGFEALLRGKAVQTFGSPFYAGWGLTHDHAQIVGRGRRRTLDELVHFALIKYPLYVSPMTRTPCTVEDMVEALQVSRRHRQLPLPGYVLRLYRKVVALPHYLRRTE